MGCVGIQGVQGVIDNVIFLMQIQSCSAPALTLSLIFASLFTNVDVTETIRDFRKPKELLKNSSRHTFLLVPSLVHRWIDCLVFSVIMFTILSATVCFPVVGSNRSPFQKASLAAN